MEDLLKSAFTVLDVSFLQFRQMVSRGIGFALQLKERHVSINDSLRDLFLHIEASLRMPYLSKFLCGLGSPKNNFDMVYTDLLIQDHDPYQQFHSDQRIMHNCVANCIPEIYLVMALQNKNIYGAFNMACMGVSLSLVESYKRSFHLSCTDKDAIIFLENLYPDYILRAECMFPGFTEIIARNATHKHWHLETAAWLLTKTLSTEAQTRLLNIALVKCGTEQLDQYFGNSLEHIAVSADAVLNIHSHSLYHSTANAGHCHRFLLKHAASVETQAKMIQNLINQNTTAKEFRILAAEIISLPMAEIFFTCFVDQSKAGWLSVLRTFRYFRGLNPTVLQSLDWDSLCMHFEVISGCKPKNPTMKRLSQMCHKTF